MYYQYSDSDNKIGLETYRPVFIIRITIPESTASLLRQGPVFRQTNATYSGFVSNPENSLSLLEINLAEGKATWQTDVAYNQPDSTLAVDGSYNPDKCSVTNTHHHPWWAVDLGQSYQLDRVVIVNEYGNLYGDSKL